MSRLWKYGFRKAGGQCGGSFIHTVVPKLPFLVIRWSSPGIHSQEFHFCVFSVLSPELSRAGTPKESLWEGSPE